MALSVTLPVSTEVIEANSDCQIRGAYEHGVLRITIDTRHQQHYQRRLGRARSIVADEFGKTLDEALHHRTGSIDVNLITGDLEVSQQAIFFTQV